MISFNVELEVAATDMSLESISLFNPFPFLLFRPKFQLTNTPLRSITNQNQRKQIDSIFFLLARVLHYTQLDTRLNHLQTLSSRSKPYQIMATSIRFYTASCHLSLIVLTIKLSTRMVFKLTMDNEIFKIE